MKLHEIDPREQKGRDTIDRFRAQFKAASLESLALLENGEIERIYCDFHEDYVVKHLINSAPKYRFVQVKTKSKLNHQYSILEIFGLKKKPKRSPIHDLAGSFAGKLLLHVEEFGGSCKSIEICTNVNFDDEVEQIIDEIHSKLSPSKHTITLISETKKLIPSLATKSDAEAVSFLSHLLLAPRKQILNEEEDVFVSQASNQIYKYSEINLSPIEVRKIIIQLLSLIEERSSTPLSSSITERDLDAKASVDLDDILDILCISRPAYYALKASGDDKAIKSVSILQRILKRSGYSDNTVDTFAGFKCNWEAWYRTNRHTLLEFRLAIAKEKIVQVAKKISTGHVDMNSIVGEISHLTSEIRTDLSRQDISEELAFGAVLSELVKGEAL
ncbi:dsDNA nuclease domain-containing protein [Pseudomonas sp. TUM22785]|uniref:dsDNA nuclease domain-containing protein n=1 Tax=Pseudomonas sp. TUM22785 TaxID=3019098 RepID=UPI002305E518|nr:dsDNA nuclease domain-containing protein [Pseudomonas sp. TUM22785]WCD82908.1 dsDNA nuclease domain-containing protein [Pseudomonas sp. TUM22785]